MVDELTVKRRNQSESMKWAAATVIITQGSGQLSSASLAGPAHIVGLCFLGDPPAPRQTLSSEMTPVAADHAEHLHCLCFPRDSLPNASHRQPRTISKAFAEKRVQRIETACTSFKRGEEEGWRSGSMDRWQRSKIYAVPQSLSPRPC